MKSKMSFREVIEIEDPKHVNKKWMGGVCGCPNDYFDILCKYFTSSTVVRAIEVSTICCVMDKYQCIECWNRKFKTKGE